MQATSARADYDARVARLAGQLAAIPPGSPVRLKKKTSNLFRTRRPSSAPRLDVTDFDGVISIDVEARTADVQGMTTYEHLLDATLAHGLAPLVVPQLKTITLGGAVTGLGIESTSFRNGLPHESVLEMDVLTGDGRVVTATPDNEHRDLFHGFPNSYGSLGYALRLRILLEPVTPWVSLRHVPFTSAAELFETMAQVCEARSHEGVPVDFVDATAFDAGELYLTLGTWTSELPAGTSPSDYTGMGIYYRSLQQRRTDVLSVRDYYWRWDTDWFWCSRAFGAQDPRIRRLWPKRLLRSDTYWKLIALEDRWHVAQRRDERRGRLPQEKVVQDVEVPIGRAAEFHEWFAREIGITPVWACPLKQRDAASEWDLYLLDPATTYVNFGFWSTVDLQPGQSDGHHNRLVEAEVERLGGRKSLYSTSYYEEDHFWSLYGGAAYERLKKEYDPQARLSSLYDKAVRNA
ncbi:FAD/FMN-containing dehydrogenase [Motilibacter peucedani]|uniref:Delta(24)-sterol reductase n=1 Tax=Motilibacter peucedani TaxID=598650 RepID=A0A420XPA2_9ACTN|nr:FAD-binding oxidoreductase [Motilibacter peucedani]RKS74030.1 FAD/FMN-containing dehydrogenase [Motilibacter peucedani]